MNITVAIPTHPGREILCDQAVRSVMRQTKRAAAISVAVDLEQQGAAHTRNRAVDGVQTEWTALLDSDDAFFPNHLQVLAQAQQDSGADYVFSWYDMLPGTVDPLPHFGKVFDTTDPTQTTITILVRTELLREYPFKLPTEDMLIHGQRYGEDFDFTMNCVKAGAKFLHVPQRTWLWRHHGKNSSGMPGRGDAPAYAKKVSA